jgi:hypothetical protein
MTTRADVKINGTYDWIETVDPTSSEKAPDYAAGERWLNTTSGDSFVLSDAAAGTWSPIESWFDAKIDRVLNDTYDRILCECYRSMLRQRSVALSESPDTIIRTDLTLLNVYVSIYANWTLSANAIDAGDDNDIIGTLEDMEYEDEVYLLGSKRNDGRKTIANVDAAGLTFDQSIVGDAADRFLVLLLDVPGEFDRIVGRMIYYDVVVRNDRLGLQTERIGTYSYTRTERIGGIEYPEDVAAGITSYLNGGPIADAEYTP